MPSDCIVPVVEVRNIREHPNADMLSIVEVLGYQLVTGLVEDPEGPIYRYFLEGERDARGRRIPANPDVPNGEEAVDEIRYSFRYKEGDRAVYFPADTLIPDKWAELFDVKHLLHGVDHDRVGRAKLRGEPSFGLIVELPEDNEWELGHNAAEFYDAKKYEPPPRSDPGDCAPYDSDIDPHFVTYTDIQNGKLLYTKFNEGEEVIATEKIHGCLKNTTRILMADGTTKSITSVAIGDEVLGVDESGRVAATPVTNVFNNGKADAWVKVSGPRRSCGRGSHHFSVICTPNHRFFAKNKDRYVAAQELESGDAILLLRSENDISPLHKQVILGKLLGDGSLHETTYSAALHFSHSEKQADYVDWSVRALSPICEIKREQVSGYGSRMICASTNFLPYIKKFAGSFLQDGNKSVPAWVEQELGPIGLAFWYMDDGSLSHHKDQEDRALFAVNGFDKKSCEVLQRALKKFGIDSVYYESAGSRLRLNAEAAEKLFLLIAPYVPKSMQYKLPVRYRGHAPWLPSCGQSYKPFLTEQLVTSVEMVACNKVKSNKYDLETETHNFFANSVLVHNSNSRIGIVNGSFAVGSRTTRKVDPFPEQDQEFLPDEMPAYKDFLFWSPIVDPGVRQLIVNILNDQEAYNANTVIVFGEIYGQGVQSLHYGQNKKKGYRAFDIYVDGRYLDYDDFKSQCDMAGVETAPVLYRGPFDLDKIKQVADGRSTLPGAKNIREGVVVRTAVERRDPALGRVVFKFIGTDYELSKHKKKDTTDL